MTPVTPLHPRRRLNWSSVGITAFLVAFWGAALLALTGCRTADAADNPTWGRTYAVADSLVVPVSWKPACNALGCADSYRVTWAMGATSDGPLARSTASTAAVLRDVTVLVPRDSVRVALPAIGQPATVCVYVVAVRRGLASDARSACRTIEAPDAAPPAVDSIKWDSLNVRPPSDALRDSLIAGTQRTTSSAYSYRTYDTIGVTRTDSFPAVRTRDAAGRFSVGNVVAGGSIQFCATQQHVNGSLVLLVPDVRGSTAEIAQYIDRCKSNVASVNGRPRLLRSDVTFEAVVETLAPTGRSS